jgi:hypothetical protein
VNAELKILDHLARVEDPDPALIPSQLDAIKRIEEAKKNGGPRRRSTTPWTWRRSWAP